MPTNINNQALLKYFKNHAVCTRCVKNCTKISGTICCKLCQRWYHTKCKKGEGRSYIPESSNFNCKECTSSFLPFFEVDDIDFFVHCVVMAPSLVKGVIGIALIPG